MRLVSASLQGVIVLGLTATTASTLAVAAPVEALASAIDEASGHAVPLAPTPWAWCIRIVGAAGLGTVTYHVVTYLIRIVKRARQARKKVRSEALPRDSSWRSHDDKTKLRIDAATSGTGTIVQSWSTPSGVRTETWRVTDLQVSGNTCNDLTGTLTCPDHGGHSGSILIHRGGHNDLRIVIEFSDAELEAIEATLKRVPAAVSLA